MESDRPHHRSGTVTGDLFICFTSLKPSSRSNNRDPPISLTTSLSRRLKTNRSIKGGASPAMFPTTGKKRNFGDNPEPSSPKVTCIGQVRVKSKKKKQSRKQSKSLSRRYSNSYGGFGRNEETLHEQSSNQKWVHFPLTICEGFSCLFPCRSSCFPVKEKVVGHRSSLCTRWFVVDDDGGGGGRRDVELMDEDDGNVRVVRRQHVFDDLEINEEDLEGRISVCVPPKNALLLMRCRSDPLKMEALANRLWESSSKNDDFDDDFDEFDDQLVEKYDEFEEIQETEQKQRIQETEQKQSIQETEKKQSIQENEEIGDENEEIDDEITFFGTLFDEIDEEIDDEMMDASDLFEEIETEEESNIEKVNGLPECLLLMMCEPKLSMEVSKETWVSSKDFFRQQPNRKKPPPPPPPPLPPVKVKPCDGQEKSKVTTFTNVAKYDKLSKGKGKGKGTGTGSGRIQPGRSSCSLPIRPSMAEILEHKLVNAVGYEPCVLTRCKSEPMRTTTAKLAPDTCYWKNRKLEPLRRATIGVGSAGIGV